MNRQLFLHVGYPKTGTTTLQKYLFPHHSEIIDLRGRVNTLKAMKSIYSSSENAFRRELDHHVSEINQSIDLRKGSYILSEESLLSYSMFFQTELAPLVYLPDPVGTARKLKMLFLDSGLFDRVKIIITVRRQDELLKSLYAQLYNYTFRHYSQTNNFKKYISYILEKSSGLSILDPLFFADIVNSYADQFGIENLKVMVFEQLQKDQETYVDELASFMEIDSKLAQKLMKDKKTNAKSGVTGYKTDTRSVVDYLGYFKKQYLGAKSWNISDWSIINYLRDIKVPGKTLDDIYFTDEMQLRIKQIFNDSNRDLDKIFKLNLSRYGYYK